MRQYEDQFPKRVGERLMATAIMLSFGLCTLGFLVAIERPEWFHIQPATGAAVAVSHAAGNAMAEQEPNL